MRIFRPQTDLPPAKHVALDSPEGVIYSGDKLIAYSTGGHIRLTGLAEGEDVTCEPVADLDLAQLQELVEFLDVDTEAKTAGGLRRAIERHLEEGGQ